MKRPTNMQHFTVVKKQKTQAAVGQPTSFGFESDAMSSLALGGGPIPQQERGMATLEQRVAQMQNTINEQKKELEQKDQLLSQKAVQLLEVQKELQRSRQQLIQYESLLARIEEISKQRNEGEARSTNSPMILPPQPLATNSEMTELYESTAADNETITPWSFSSTLTGSSTTVLLPLPTNSEMTKLGESTATYHETIAPWTSSPLLTSSSTVVLSPLPTNSEMTELGESTATYHETIAPWSPSALLTSNSTAVLSPLPTNSEMTELGESTATYHETIAPWSSAPMLTSGSTTVLSPLLTNSETGVSSSLRLNNNPLTQPLCSLPIDRIPLQSPTIQRPDSGCTIYRKYLKYSLLNELLIALRKESLQRTSFQDNRYDKFVVCLEHALGKFRDFRIDNRTINKSPSYTLATANMVLEKERLVTWIFISILGYKCESDRPDWMDSFIEKFIQIVGSANLKKRNFNTFSSFSGNLRGLSKKINSLINLDAYNPAITAQSYEQLKPTELENQRDNFKAIFGSKPSETFYQCFKRMYFSEPALEPGTTDLIQDSVSFSSPLFTSSGLVSTAEYSFFSHSLDRNTAPTTSIGGNLEITRPGRQ